MIYDIVKEPADVLRNKAVLVATTELGTPKMSALIKDMIETMYRAKGVGLAAPQIGIGKQIIIVAPPDEEPIAVINPVVTNRSIRRVASEEGCLSVPGTWGITRRNATLKIKGLTPEGKPFKKSSIGFEAIIFQHEVDHLNGILYIDKAKDIHRLGVHK
jgi:peptide deformylase